MLIELFGINISENTKMLADSTFFANLPSTGIWNAKKFPGGTAIWPFTGSKSSSTNTGGKIIVRKYGNRYLNGYKLYCDGKGRCACKQAAGAMTPYGTLDACARAEGGRSRQPVVADNQNTNDSCSRIGGYKNGWNIKCESGYCYCFTQTGCWPFSSETYCKNALKIGGFVK